MRIFAFKPLIPSSNEDAESILSPPYDIVDKHEAASIISEKPQSVLKITRPDAEHQDLESADPQVYESASASLEALISAKTVSRASRPAIYIYSQTTPANHAQHGVVATVAASDYDAGLIRRHEHTRREKEDDRTHLAETVRAHVGLVFLTHRPAKEVSSIVSDIVSTIEPKYSITTPDGVSHIVREVPETHTDKLVSAFADHVPATYIADGHHRAASAARVARATKSPPESPAAQFPAVMFAATDLQLLPYHRVSTSIPQGFESALMDAVGPLEKLGGPMEPRRAGIVHIRLPSGWFAFSLLKPTKDASRSQRLDCARLQETVLAPLLGVKDPRACNHLSFVGGVHGVEELDRRVEDGRVAMAFALYPVDINDLMTVADENEVMPPKSTWFEPKLWSGFFIHTF